jgi:circadian clock protein KaiB
MKTKEPVNTNTSEKLQLQLYVAGMSAKSMTAIKNIKTLCSKYLANNYELEIIDIYKNPEVASRQQIIFSPSLIKLSPPPRKILIGTFSDEKKVFKALGIDFEE